MNNLQWDKAHLAALANQISGMTNDANDVERALISQERKIETSALISDAITREVDSVRNDLAAVFARRELLSFVSRDVVDQSATLLDEKVDSAINEMAAPLLLAIKRSIKGCVYQSIQNQMMRDTTDRHFGSIDAYLSPAVLAENALKRPRSEARPTKYKITKVKTAGVFYPRAPYQLEENFRERPRATSKDISTLEDWLNEKAETRSRPQRQVRLNIKHLLSLL